MDDNMSTDNNAISNTYEEYRIPLITDRSIVKILIFSLFTFGIYSLFFYNEIASAMNTIATKYDDKNTKSYIIAVILGFVTFGIFPIVWFIQLVGRIERELKRRNISCNFTLASFLCWQIFGAIIIIGPIISIYKLITAINLLSEDYNING